jgi:hypothetical protein
LSLVEVHGQDPIGSRDRQHVGDQPGGDRDARLILLVGAPVAVVRDDGGDASGAGPLEGVDHDQQLHDRLVHGAARRLHQEHVLLADVLHDPHEDVLVRELEDLDRADIRLQVPADALGQGSIGVAGVDTELVGVHRVVSCGAVGQARRFYRTMGPYDRHGGVPPSVLERSARSAGRCLPPTNQRRFMQGGAGSSLSCTNHRGLRPVERAAQKHTAATHQLRRLMAGTSRIGPG